MFEDHGALEQTEGRLRAVLVVFGMHLEELANPVEPGERFADLRPDRGDLHDRRRHQTGQDEIENEVTERHGARENRPAADDDHDDADHANNDGRERGDCRDAGNRFGDVAEEPMHALGKDELFTLLGGVGLDDPDPSERLVQPASHLGIDLPALAEEWPKAVEGERHRAAEGGQRPKRREREPPVQIKEDPERDHGGHDAAGELDEAGADDVTNTLSVRHDPRDQDAGLRRVEIAYG